ncbi:MAG: protein kinase [Vicinamibacteria bacterium]|nr:protein kinase [Vicinamibacteria bacterium]
MECPSCNAQLADDARFCQRCGAAVVAASVEPSDPLREALTLALGRQYEVAGLLGKGGMGAVYLAREAALEREVAIKVLPPDRGTTQDSRDRFRREARTAARLSHPNIVPLYTFGDVDGTLYFVMGYVKGESLATRLKREGKLPVEESRRILIEVAEALEYAHKLGIVHRDIKPDNVLIEEGTGRALLTDFGIAKAVGAGQTMTTAGSVVGTPHYMSPEQAQGKADIDARSDIYSLGVMGYAILAGRLPFEGPTPGDVMVQHITKEPPTLASLASGIPPEIQAALTRCLAKNPDQRWLDATRLKAALAGPGSDQPPAELLGLGDLFWGSLAATFVLLLLAAWWLSGGSPSFPYPLLLAFAVGMVAFLALDLTVGGYRAMRAGFEPSRIVREVLKQPEGWFGWYPTRFRRAGDVWRRLPPQLRWARWASGWTAMFFLLLSPFFVFILADLSNVLNTGRGGRDNPDLKWAFLALSSILPMGGAAVWLVVQWWRFARIQGLSPQTATRAFDVSTANQPFWAKPEVAVLLLPDDSATHGGSLQEPTTVASLVDAVRIIAAHLPETARSLGVQIEASVLRLAASISSLDIQIAGVAQAFDPPEAKRLVDRLAALGLDDGPADERREVREILQRQVDAVRSLEARLERAKSRRARRFELLKALWLQVVDLQAAAHDPVKTGHTTDRIRKLFDQIDEHTGGPKATVPTGGDTHPLGELPTLER